MKIMKSNVKRIFCIIVLIGVIKDSHEIWGGEKAQSGWFPYQAAVYFFGKFLCGGTIISEKHILTAAHCIAKDYKYMSVSVGSIDLYDLYAIYKRIDEVKIPQQYFLGNLHYDIAVITLDSSFPMGAQISSAPLFKHEYDHQTCDLCMFAGWGPSANGSETQHNLLLTTMIVLSHDSCKKRARHYIESHQFCTIGDFGAATLDKGDSGGALVCSGPVIGVSTSREKITGGVAIFTKIFPHLQFILKAMTH